MRNSVLFSSLAFFALAASPQAAPSGESEEGVNNIFEISPSAGFMGGSPLVGARASMHYSIVTLELSGEQVIGRSATLFPLCVNAVLDLTQSRKAVPYGMVGGGLFMTVPANTVGDKTVSTVGLDFGAGFRYYFSNKLGLRFETKQLFTRVENRVDNRKELLIFQSTSLGVIFAFG